MHFPGAFRTCCILFALSAVASASQFANLIVYGDSLSDNGNLFAASGYPPPPYFDGRLSNGPVAVEVAASLLNAQLMDFAWAGATTGIGNIADNGTPTSLGALGAPGMQVTFQQSLATVTPLAPDSLFVVWGGADDFESPSPLDATPQAIADRAVANLVGMVLTLEGLGADQVLVAGIPDLGLTPRALTEGPAASAQLSALTDYFNARLRAELPPGAVYVDMAGLLREMVLNPSAYGLTNVTDACLSDSPCASPDQYLFWDDIHPSAVAHAAAGQVLATAAAVPEPAAGLVLLGPVLFILVKRLRAERPAATRRP